MIFLSFYRKECLSLQAVLYNTKFCTYGKDNDPGRQFRNLSTLAVLQLDAILVGAKKVSIKKVKVGNKNQKPFERMMIMEYELNGIGKVKMTVGIRRRTKEKVQYCIKAISSL